MLALCFEACWFGELSQQPIRPHSAHLRRCSHQPPVAKQSTQPVPVGFAFGLIPSLKLHGLSCLIVLKLTVVVYIYVGYDSPRGEARRVGFVLALTIQYGFLCGLISQYENVPIINANPAKVRINDKGGYPISTAHAEAAKMIIAIDGNRNFSFFCLVSRVLSGLRPVYSNMVRKINMPTIIEAST